MIPVLSRAQMRAYDRHAIETWRILFGVTVSRNRMAWGELATIEPRIAARHQNVFTPESVF